MTNNIEEVTFSRDSTTRLSCRKGDYIIWFSWASIFGNPKQNIRVQDVWELYDGDFITITNRIEDFPEWLKLYPTEVTGSLVYKLIEEFNKGNYPEQPIEGSNIWRPKTGDRLVWFGSSKPNSTDNTINKVIYFNECSFVIGENAKFSLYESLVDFGALSKTTPTNENVELAIKAQEWVLQKGLPREFSESWKIG